MKNLKPIIKLLKREKFSDSKIKEILTISQSQYWGLSALEFITLSPKLHSKIVLDNFKQMLYGEIMGA